MPVTAETPEPPASGEQTPLPRVWVVTAYRAGERAQILALAEALGWPYEVKELAHRVSAASVGLFRASSLLGYAADSIARLAPPWPDLVISAGMRNEPACRWIRTRSGGRTRIVHIGRPWAALARFDLVITTPQYRLPERPNVLNNSVTLYRVTPERMQSEARRWEPRLNALPGPRIAVIVGGNSGPYTFGPEAARRLAKQASAMARAQGGSLLVTTSARTGARATRVLAEHIDVPAHFYTWRPGDADNPYYGFLALADALIVTADSISMLTEACATGKPVYMFDLGCGRRAMHVTTGPEACDNDFRLSGWSYRWLMRVGWKRLSRDITLVHQRLRAAGHAVWLGEAFAERRPPAFPDLQRAVDRVRALFDAPDQG